MDAEADLSAYVARLRRLRELAALAAKIAAPRIEAQLKASAAAGTTPDGTPWAPRARGGRALANAGAAISVAALGTTVIVTLSGPEVYHQHGSGHVPKRAIIPDSGTLPAPTARLVDESAREAFSRLMGGR